MRPFMIVFIALITVSSIGCKSKQDQLAEAYAQLDTMNTQYQKDCLLAPWMSLHEARPSAKPSAMRWNRPARSFSRCRPISRLQNADQFP